MEENANAVLEQILKSVRDQSLLADQHHEAQAAFNAHVSQQLQSISKQLDLTCSASPTAASAPEAAESMLAKVALECGGDISASQEEVLANASFPSGDNALPPLSDEDYEDEEEEVFSTPRDAIQQQDDPATDDKAPPAKKPRVSISKVRGDRIRTPTPISTQL